LNKKHINIKEIYVPKKHIEGFSPKKVLELTEILMEGGELESIKIREGKGRYVLIEGVHRLEAFKAVGEKVIFAHIIGAQLF